MSKKPDPFLEKLGSEMQNAASAVRAAASVRAIAEPLVEIPVKEAPAGTDQMKSALNVLGLPKAVKETQTFNARPADIAQIAIIKSEIASITGRSNVSAGSAIRVALRAYKTQRPLREVILEVVSEDGRGRR